MKKRTATTGFNPRQLVQLLAIGLETNRQSCISDDRTRTDLLCALLSGLLPLDMSASGVDRSGSTRARGQPHMTGGGSLGEILFGGGVDIRTMTVIKDCAKRLAACGEGRDERSVYTVIYFAAIAGAKIFCDRKITKLSNETLVNAFGELAEKEWLPLRLTKHFIQARDIFAEKQIGILPACETPSRRGSVAGVADSSQDDRY